MMNDPSSDTFSDGLDRNQGILETDYAAIIESALSFPYIAFLERRDDNNISLQIKPPEYSSSRLTNFILFEQQRKQLAIRAKYVNELTDDDDDPFVPFLAFYLMPAGSGKAAAREGKAMSYNIRIQTRLNITVSEVEKVLQQLDMLPNAEELHLIDGVEDRFSYEISYAKKAAQDSHASKQYENSIKICNKFLEKFPEDLEMLFTLGFSYHDNGEPELAEAAFMLIIEYFYENAYAWFNLAVIYQELKDDGKELFCLMRAFEFGYPADTARIEELDQKCKPVDPFSYYGYYNL